MPCLSERFIKIFVISTNTMRRVVNGMICSAVMLTEKKHKGGNNIVVDDRICLRNIYSVINCNCNNNFSDFYPRLQRIQMRQAASMGILCDIHCMFAYGHVE